MRTLARITCGKHLATKLGTIWLHEDQLLEAVPILPILPKLRSTRDGNVLVGKIFHTPRRTLGRATRFRAGANQTPRWPH